MKLIKFKLLDCEGATYNGAYTGCLTRNACAGPISNSIYYVDFLRNPDICGVRRMNPNGTVNWIVTFGAEPDFKAFKVDSQETSVYIATWTSPVSVVILDASSGNISRQIRFNCLNGQGYAIKILLMSDGSGFYIASKGSANGYVNLCKYLNSASSSTNCQQINTMYSEVHGQLIITDTTVFLMATENTAQLNLHMYKITFSSTTAVWANKINCPTTNCMIGQSEMTISSDTSKIYNFVNYGANGAVYGLFFSLSITDGSAIGNRYITSDTCGSFYGQVIVGNYLAAVGTCSGDKLFLFNIVTEVFIIKLVSAVHTNYQVIQEPTYSRLLIAGKISIYGYETKFTPESISAHPDFSASTTTMNLLTLGNYDIVAETGVILNSVAQYTLTAPSYSISGGTYINDTVDYYSSDVNFQTNDESYLYLLESSSYSIVPNLSCSTTGSTSILYSLSSYNGGAVPSWIALSASTGAMTISTPTITSSSSDVSFYIVSQIGSPIKNVNKLITLRVNKCSASNCQSCSTTDSTKCASCKTGYELSSGSCVATSTSTTSTTATTTTVQEVPESVKNLGTSSKAVTGSTVVTAVVSNMLSSSSLSSIWSTINQLQLLFMIILTQIYLPYSVSEFILGNKFAFSPFEFIPVQKIEYLDDLINWFNYGQSNSFVSKIGFKSISTFVNECPFFTSFIIALLIHLCLYLIVLLTKRLEETEYRWLITKVICWIIRKVFEFFTFSYYVRITTEAFQHLLISSITEINNFDSHSTETIVSLLVAFGVILFCIAFFLISLVLSLKTITEDDQNLGKFREYFSGVKNNKSSRIFTPLWILRRIIFVTLLVTLVSKAKTIVMSTVSFLQLLYTIYLIFQRPLDGAKENFIEIMNEIFFCVFIGWLFFFNSESRWTSSITNIYIWILSANNFMILVIVCVSLISLAISKMMKRCKKVNRVTNDNNEEDHTRIENNILNYPIRANAKVKGSKLNLKEESKSINEVYRSQVGSMYRF